MKNSFLRVYHEGITPSGPYAMRRDGFLVTETLEGWPVIRALELAGYVVPSTL